MKSDPSKNINSTAKKKNYLSGFFGALIFSLLGIMVWSVLVNYLGYLTPVLTPFIYFLARRGYRMFYGKEGSVTPFILGFTNLIVVMVASIIGMGVILYLQKPDFNMVVFSLSDSKETHARVFSYLIISSIASILTSVAFYAASKTNLD